MSRIWRAFGLKPHPVDSRKLAKDPQFVDKVRDVVGLYISPPKNALVLAVDEKSQVQALDRTAPILPMMPRTPARATHDYVRHGTTIVFAAMDILSGAVARNYPRHRSAEFLRFLKEVDKATAKDLDLHLVLDNYATHKTPAVKDWLLKHPRVVLHFTPTSASWLNLVERWFAELTAANCNARPTAPSSSSNAASSPGPRTGTTTPSPSSGPRPPSRFSKPSPATANESTTHDTSSNPGSRFADRAALLNRPRA